MEKEIKGAARLGVDDKRHLFSMLQAMTERLFMLNKFPVDQHDFALSMLPVEEEAAFRLLYKNQKQTLSLASSNVFVGNNILWKLHNYPNDAGPPKPPRRLFLSLEQALDINEDNRFKVQVLEWVKRQIRLEEQLLKTIKIIKAIVHSCNTVGQYQRVSPDLLTFLPDKYKVGLKDYTKKSPYPAMKVLPSEIDVAMSTLAYAALQPKHFSEEQFINAPNWRNKHYQLLPFPRGVKYDQSSTRQLQL